MCIKGHRLLSKCITCDIGFFYIRLRFSENVAQHSSATRSRTGLILFSLKIDEIANNFISVLSSALPYNVPFLYDNLHEAGKINLESLLMFLSVYLIEFLTLNLSILTYKLQPIRTHES